MSEESDDPPGWGVLVPGRGRIGHIVKMLYFSFFLSNSFQTCSEQFEYKFIVVNEASTIMLKFYSLR